MSSLHELTFSVLRESLLSHQDKCDGALSRDNSRTFMSLFCRISGDDGSLNLDESSASLSILRNHAQLDWSVLVEMARRIIVTVSHSPSRSLFSAIWIVILFLCVHPNDERCSHLLTMCISILADVENNDDDDDVLVSTHLSLLFSLCKSLKFTVDVDLLSHSYHASRFVSILV